MGERGPYAPAKPDAARLPLALAHSRHAESATRAHAICGLIRAALSALGTAILQPLCRAAITIHRTDDLRIANPDELGRRSSTHDGRLTQLGVIGWSSQPATAYTLASRITVAIRATTISFRILRVTAHLAFARLPLPSTAHPWASRKCLCEPKKLNRRKWRAEAHLRARRTLATR